MPPPPAPSKAPPVPSGPAARELAPLPLQRVTSTEGIFTAEVEAVAAPKLTRHEGSTRLEIPLGTEAPLSCFVYERPIDAAGAVIAVAKAAQGHRSVSVRSLTPTDVSVVAGAPVMFVDMDYEVATSGDRVSAGRLKLMVSASPELPLLCAHDEPGYARTFQRITTGIATTLQVPGQPRAPVSMTELRVLKLDGRLAGFEWRTGRSLGGGTQRTEAFTSLLLPGSENGPRAEDRTITTVTDDAGQLLEQRHAYAENGGLKLQVTLRRDRPSKPPRPMPATAYRYEGRQGSRTLKGHFTSIRGVATEEMIRTGIRDGLLTGDASEVLFDVYRPEADATAPTEVVLRRTPAAGPRALTVTTGTVTEEARADASGALEWTERILPEGRLTTELVYATPAPGKDDSRP
ncbi:putative lipoprotein [Myxococcus hansupus]|uniref:Putative lipoprotein n=2 Tax=Pseudomyxococcus hansupus TaxID=1297742 RepID=A0A0H4X6E5_9BACT|nr:putative lipoprotein [Myxococcus hansupus]